MALRLSTAEKVDPDTTSIGLTDSQREARLRARLSELPPNLADDMRFLLEQLDEARAGRYQVVADGRPAEGQDCIVVDANGRKSFVRILYGRPTAYYPALPAGQWEDPWHDIVQYLPLP